MSRLPVESIRTELERASRAGAVVVSSPTGSGKSTEIPRWLAALHGRVLVVEPRRVACRSLAARVADLEGVKLGSRVGYSVRDEHVADDTTSILYATPGMVLQSRGMVSRFDALVLDEFHERSLDLDLLLALFAKRTDGPRLVVMSATLEGDRVAAHVGGTHLVAEGRTHPVDVRYVDAGPSLPSGDDLAARVASAVSRASADTGDVLVFLPGKAEIEACARALGASPYEIIPMHGGLSLDAQRRGFEASTTRRVILATNVAETSITLPGVGVVIDTGLVRRTRYHAGRGFLALAPIAEDSATQRAGRAGRTGPGVCYRLWGRGARLEASTPPEIHRESLVPLLLGAAAWNTRVSELAFFDPPKAYAVDAARAELVALGALDAEDALTARGRELHGLPLDAPLARLLVEARESSALEDVIDLVAALSVGRPMFVSGRDRDSVPVGDPPCDATRLVLALRGAGETPVSSVAVSEAHANRARLRRAFGLPATSTRERVDRDALVAIALAADPRSAHVARRRGRDLGFSNGGTEVELARESAIRDAKDVAAIVVFETRAFGTGPDARVLVTCASPVTLAVLARAGLGSERIESVRLERGRIVANLERVYAKCVIGTRDQTPEGALARDAIATLFLRGSLFKDALATSKERLAIAALACALGQSSEVHASVRAGPTLEAWARARIDELGIETAEDLALLSPADLTVPDVPFLVRSEIERDYPRTVSVGDATYEADYDLATKRVTLRLVRGQRKDPPPLSYLPRFAGLGIVVTSPRGTTVLRARG